ncbi:unannotated protein [freshwater metagenome]|uniref:Unannotated protein n=1 Tax=freshwater metagenome TaxID=449393 RepID=A0A6J6WWL4_9ZZZZ
MLKNGVVTQTALRVILVDDHSGFRAAVQSLLALDEQFAVIASTDSAESALEIISRAVHDHEAPPDLVVMDVNMAGMNGMVGAARMVAEHPGVKVVLCSTSPLSQLPPLPRHDDITFVSKDSIDPDALREWASRQRA